MQVPKGQYGRIESGHVWYERNAKPKAHPGMTSYTCETTIRRDDLAINTRDWPGLVPYACINNMAKGVGDRAREKLPECTLLWLEQGKRSEDTWSMVRVETPSTRKVRCETQVIML